jgi:hypothetical protein
MQHFRNLITDHHLLTLLIHKPTNFLHCQSNNLALHYVFPSLDAATIFLENGQCQSVSLNCIRFANCTHLNIKREIDNIKPHHIVVALGCKLPNGTITSLYSNLFLIQSEE